MGSKEWGLDLRSLGVALGEGLYSALDKVIRGEGNTERGGQSIGCSPHGHAVRGSGKSWVGRDPVSPLAGRQKRRKMCH